MNERKLQYTPLGHRLDTHRRIAQTVRDLASDNPYGALHVIESLDANERTPSLYGIVFEHVTRGEAEFAAEDPDRFEKIKTTDAYKQHQKLSAYCLSKMPYFNEGEKKPHDNAPATP